jgi:hypothetical protein
MAAATATGAPNPAAPSTNAPKQNAISNAWRRLSPVRLPIESLITSNRFVATVIRYRTIDQNMIQQMGKRPNAAP